MRFWRRRAPVAETRTTEEQVVQAPPPRPMPFWPWLLLLLLLVLGGLAASWWWTNREDTVEAEAVPSVVGLQSAQAEQRLRERGFEVEPKRVVSERPAGAVVDQRPDPGKLYGEGGIVVISVARDPLKVEVPDVSGLKSQVALARLRAADLSPRAQAIQSQKPRGQVIRQVPKAGTEVQKNTGVVVLVSAGQQRSDVPDVVGLTADEATDVLTEAGFRTRLNRVPGTEPAGTVIAQAPAAGTKLRANQVVRINVSLGQTQTTTTVVTTTTTPARSTVPDVVGQDEGTAVSTVEGAGFRTRIVERAVSDPNQDGVVIRQSPAGGTSAASNSTVTLTVGRLR